MTSARPKKVYQLKIVLQHIKPPIWRRLQVPDMTLAQLSDYILTTMGWIGGHLHGFNIRGEAYGIIDPEWGMDWMIDESKVRMSDVIFSGDKKFVYDYDFGDGWEHDVLIEKVLPYDQADSRPLCLKGKRACPPEDVGGPWGYENFLEAIGDPAHPEHNEFLEWVGGGFDPEEFNLDEINEDLKDIEKNGPLWKLFEDFNE